MKKAIIALLLSAIVVSVCFAAAPVKTKCSLCPKDFKKGDLLVPRVKDIKDGKIIVEYVHRECTVSEKLASLLKKI